MRVFFIVYLHCIENVIKFLCYTEVPKFHCTLKNNKFETLIQRVDHHDITEILLKVALNTINHKNHQRVGYCNPQPHPYHHQKNKNKRFSLEMEETQKNTIVYPLINNPGSISEYYFQYKKNNIGREESRNSLQEI